MSWYQAAAEAMGFQNRKELAPLFVPVTYLICLRAV